MQYTDAVTETQRDRATFEKVHKYRHFCDERHKVVTFFFNADVLDFGEFKE